MLTTVIVFLVGGLLGWVGGKFSNPLCAWYALRASLVTFQRVGGHRMREDERLTNCNVMTLKCDLCGCYEVTWEPTARSARWPYPDEARSSTPSPATSDTRGENR